MLLLSKPIYVSVKNARPVLFGKNEHICTEFKALKNFEVHTYTTMKATLGIRAVANFDRKETKRKVYIQMRIIKTFSFSLFIHWLSVI